MLFSLVCCALLLAGLNGCGRSRITSVVPQRGAPGETFTIYGTHLKDTYSLPFIPPRLSRCDEFTLVVLDAQEDHIRVRIPSPVRGRFGPWPGIPAGLYQVYAFGEPMGAYQRARTNSLPFWVTAAPVPYDVTNQYEVQVKSFRAHYGKSADWEAWMLANRARYENVFAAAHVLPCPLKIAVSYASLPPLPYNPPWTNEDQHMAALNRMSDGAFSGYHFAFTFGLDAGAAYGQAILGVAGTSYASGRTVYLHYETIFDHEFGHVLNVQHHYDSDSTVGTGQHFPPGETGCIMDRNSEQYCSACRTALNLPLDIDNYDQIDSASTDILSRYPPGW